MKKVRDIKQRLRHAFLAATAIAAFAATAGGMAFADETTYVDAPKPGGTVKLYSAPGDRNSVMIAPTLPLRVTGASQHGFYPVTVNQQPYWVDGMDVKTIRNAQARCSQSAGIQSAGTLGAATNRCQ